MDKIIEQLGNCSTQELQNIANTISEEIKRRNREEVKMAFQNFEKAFEKYVKVNPTFMLCVDCETCHESYGVSGELVLRDFFTKIKRQM